MLILLQFYTEKASGKGLGRVEQLHLGVLDGLHLLALLTWGYWNLSVVLLHVKSLS